jgi:OmpA-OmpF porin, OOP family
MKKITLIIITLLTSLLGYSQDDNAEIAKDSIDIHNKWTIELNVGQTKGVRPYATGYYSSKPNGLFGQFEANSFSLAVRKMFSPKFGYKFSLLYDKIGPNGSNLSKPFQMVQLGITGQLYVNAVRLLDSQEYLGRWSLLLHGGFQVVSMTSKTANTPIPGEPESHNQNYGVTEYNGGIIIGVTPEYRVSKRLALMFDLANVNNYRQHFNWDGSYSTESNNLAGQQITTSLGLSYSFGNEKLHGDWAIYRDGKTQELEDMGKRLDDMETMMNDTDKDGVPDYIDVENNSITGVAVDTKGRMIDLNKNGIPDELEKSPYDGVKDSNNTKNGDNTSISSVSSTAGNAMMVKKLINDGYVCAYFDVDKVEPTNASTEGIDFILTYLRNNPTATVDIIGHADVVGSSEYNDELSKNRSAKIKEILIKAGVNPTRLSIIFKGEDPSVEASATIARRLVRKVTFEVKNK